MSTVNNTRVPSVHPPFHRSGKEPPSRRVEKNIKEKDKLTHSSSAVNQSTNNCDCTFDLDFLRLGRSSLDPVPCQRCGWPHSTASKQTDLTGRGRVAESGLISHHHSPIHQRTDWLHWRPSTATPLHLITRTSHPTGLLPMSIMIW